MPHKKMLELKDRMNDSRNKKLCVCLSIALLAGCGSIESDKNKCISKASEELKAFLPRNDFEKKELESRSHGIFYRCMKESGYTENRRWGDYWEPVAKYSSESEKRSYSDVINEFRRQSMYEEEKGGSNEPFWTFPSREFFHIVEAGIEKWQRR